MEDPVVLALQLDDSDPSRLSVRLPPIPLSSAKLLDVQSLPVGEGSPLWEMKKIKKNKKKMLISCRHGREKTKNPISFCDGRNQAARSMMHENIFSMKGAIG